jgi:antitoxin (DNA-binding transcriptional repressor) of toxin-antitoxin stability system
MTHHVSIEEAQQRWKELIGKAEANGDTVLLYRNLLPVAEIVCLKKNCAQFIARKGRDGSMSRPPCVSD